MLDFKLLNIPVRIEPFFWVMGFLLGNGININSRQDLMFTLLWILILLFSILVHEFGHALVSRKVSGATPSIKLWAMGGLAYPNTSLNREQRLKVTWAGPLAGLAFFVVILLTCCLVYGFGSGARIVAYLLYPRNIGILNVDSLLILSEMKDGLYHLIRGLVLFNFWWSLVNLLPVYPLDGGQIYSVLERSQRKVYQVGLITGVLVAVIGLLVFQSFFIAMLFGFLAFQNFQRLQQEPGGRH